MQSTPAQPAPQWIRANDRIYWRNGICDRAFYDSALAYTRARLIQGEAAQVQNQTPWAPFIEETPKHIVQYLDPIDFIIQPWANL